MKKILLILLMISSSLLHASEDESYDFVDAGEVKLSVLERAISPVLDYADIKILNLRRPRSYNPFTYIFGEDFIEYKITFKLNGVDEATCELNLDRADRQFFLTSCYSETARLDPTGFIQFEDLGLRHRLNNY